MAMHVNRRTALLLASASAMSLATPLTAQDVRLRLAFIPQENPEKLLGDIEAITGWLASEVGVPVEGFVTIDHAAAVVATSEPCGSGDREGSDTGQHDSCRQSIAGGCRQQHTQKSVAVGP